jgi:hypothetical protein
MFGVYIEEIRPLFPNPYIGRKSQMYKKLPAFPDVFLRQLTFTFNSHKTIEFVLPPNTSLAFRLSHFHSSDNEMYD